MLAFIGVQLQGATDCALAAVVVATSTALDSVLSCLPATGLVGITSLAFEAWEV